MLEQIESIPTSKLLNTSVDDLCDYFAQEFTVEVPQIEEAKISVDQQEADVDVSADFNRALLDRSRAFYLKGTSVSFYVPFDGDENLGYTAWRDTKTALLIFNRRKNFSAVLKQIPALVRAHPNYKRDLLYASETGFRFVLHHKNDSARELILTVRL